MVPGDNMPALVRQGQEQLEALQEQKNYLARTLVDNNELRLNAAMCVGTPPPNMSAGSFGQLSMKPGGMIRPSQPPPIPATQTLKVLLMQQMRNLIPPVVWENVYRTDETRLDAELCEMIKFTFFNDQTIKLKVRLEEETSMMGGINVVTPICDDFEEWCATAIMMCDAGEDVWDRPKPESSGASQVTASQVSAMQAQQNRLMQGAVAGAASGLIQPALQRLTQGMFGSGPWK